MIDVGSRLEDDIDGKGTITGRLRHHIKHVVDAIDLLLDGRRYRLGNHFGGCTCEAFKKHGFRQVGYWQNRIGGNDQQLVYMLAWEDLKERVRKFDTFAKDPDRARVLGESEKNGPIVQQVRNTILRPTAFSPMK